MTAERGVSTVVGYVLALAITVALVGSLIAATGGIVDDRRDATARRGLDVVGERLAAKLMAADRLAATGADTVAVDADLPATVAGTGYTVTVNDSKTDPHLRLTSGGTDTEVRVDFANRTDVAATSVTGGDVTVTLAGGELEVRTR